MIKNKFNIICCSYNNEEWAETHLESILEQTYDNYEVIYVNDTSTDKTMEIVNKIVKNDKRFHIIDNKVNVDSPTNYFKCSYEFMEDKDDNEILVELCGDDWFATPTVLEQLNEVYNNTDCWLTYGGMRVWNGGKDITLPDPQNSDYHPFVHKHSLYRKDSWKAGHLHSFRWFLHKQFDYKKDAISRFDNEIFKHAVDLQLQFSVMEMCPPNKIVNLNFPTVVFNNAPKRERPLKDGTFRNSEENVKYEIEVRNKKKYKKVSSKKELKGEKLDVVEWREDKIRFIIEALGPADIELVEIDEDTKSAKVIVKDNQLSLAIGKEGQNARLAAKLTGYKIDIEGLGDSPDVEEEAEKKQEEE